MKKNKQIQILVLTNAFDPYADVLALYIVYPKQRIN